MHMVNLDQSISTPHLADGDDKSLVDQIRSSLGKGETAPGKQSKLTILIPNHAN